MEWNHSDQRNTSPNKVERHIHRLSVFLITSMHPTNKKNIWPNDLIQTSVDFCSVIFSPSNLFQITNDRLLSTLLSPGNLVLPCLKDLSKSTNCQSKNYTKQLLKYEIIWTKPTKYSSDWINLMVWYRIPLIACETCLKAPFSLRPKVWLSGSALSCTPNLCLSEDTVIFLTFSSWG